MKNRFSIKHLKWIVGLIFFVIIVKFVYDYMTDESAETFNNLEQNKCYIKLNEQPKTPHCKNLFNTSIPHTVGQYFMDGNYKNSHANTNNCNHRINDWKNWCGVNNVETKYEEYFEPNKCYIKLNEQPKTPHCKNLFNNSIPHTVGQYFMDGKYKNSHANTNNCNNRIKDWKNWCGINNVETKYEDTNNNLEFTNRKTCNACVSWPNGKGEMGLWSIPENKCVIYKNGSLRLNREGVKRGNKEYVVINKYDNFWRNELEKKDCP
jgi:hypothetical protein